MTTRNPFHSTLVALTGPAGCGKDTVADLLVAHRGFTKLAFADALRGEVAEAFGIDLAHLVRRETKEHPISALALSHCLDFDFVMCMALKFQTADILQDEMLKPRSPRQILQWWGTEYRRAQDADYWTLQALNQIAVRELHGQRRFVIADCRFDNEAALVRMVNGHIWQIKRPGLEVAPGAHISEVSGDQFRPDVVINNGDSIEHLQDQVLGAFDGLNLLEAA